MNELWLQLLQQHVATKGQATVARELGYSAGAVSQVLSGKYAGSAENVGQRVLLIYGHDGKVQCPELGALDPLVCLETHARAQRIGVRAGNPRTARRYHRCRRCPVRR